MKLQTAPQILDRFARKMLRADNPNHPAYQYSLQIRNGVVRIECAASPTIEFESINMPACIARLILQKPSG